MAKVPKPSTSLEARQRELGRARDLIGQSLDNLQTAGRILGQLQHAATIEEGELLKAELAAAREAGGK